MAHDAMARAFGPIDAVPPPPPHSFSRYRTLRGKSVSSPRDFDIFRDDGRSARNHYSSAGPTQSSSGSPPSRSKSVSSFRHVLRQHGGSVATPPVPPVPPLPRRTEVLCPKPINVAAQSKLKILENLKSPSFHPEHPPWKSLSGISRSVSRADAPKCRGAKNRAAGPGPGPGPGRPGPGSGAGSGAAPAAAAAAAAAAAGPSMTYKPHRGQGQGSHRSPIQQQDVLLDSPDSSQKIGAEKKVHAKGESGLNPEPEPEPEPASRPEPEPEPEPELAREPRVIISKQQSHSIQQQSPGISKCAGEQFAAEVARLEAETDRILAEQKKLDLARLQAQLVTPPKPKRQILEKLSFFSRGKRLTGTSSQPSTPSTVVSAIFSPTLSHYSRDSSLEEPLTPSNPSAKMAFIEPGGKGIVPQMDAPISAINGGERRVIVRCFSSTINLPVTADTSPMDILTAAADTTRHHLTPATCVIVECYFVLGLERRLRRYERIRDVMNSWDRDQQNSLLVMSCDTTQSDHDLEIESVPRTEEPPSGFCVQMYHSSKPGKWNKRWVTLLDNGQMYAAKSANAQPSDKESSVLCHLTDFDIYAPKESEMRRNLRPPKRFCYAIKSQQKTVVFPNGENFVHFFSTEDAQQAAFFYEKVHGWRSWYMVNRMIVLDKKEKSPQQVLDAAGNKHNSPSPKNSTARNGHGAGTKVSDRAAEAADEPLMDVNGFRMSKIIIEKTATQKLLPIRSKGSVRVKHAAAAPEIPKTVSEEEPEFSVGGLLGDTYEKRKQTEATLSTTGAKLCSSSRLVDGPFTETPSLLNGGITQSSLDSSGTSKKKHAEHAEHAEQEEKKDGPKSWFPSAAEHSARIRYMQQQQRRPMTADTPTSSSSTTTTAAAIASGVPRRDRHPTPLLNFTKDFPEPPRFHNPGVRQAPGQPLINLAMGGATRDSRDAAVRRNSGRHGLSPSNSGGGLAGAASPPPTQYPPPPPGKGPQRQRSKSSASQRRNFPFDAHKHHPVPPMPMRRPHLAEAPSRPPSRSPPEPLVNRAR
ncbi:hypothetical protein C2857_005334 [Epichloe festucae Fl1]|uniref:PH domain-containing protein n=1 Tax=Epichloe festucae (strain Fl1) TaxID=877507 RepID=A0A7S9PU60_EPIFF|nr:hypothetical protein C2857_005334 [Epichloe festucae Fl1]